MRRDMSRVLVERPRYHGGPRRRGRKVDLELLPLREPMSPGRGGTKSLSDYLSPLRRLIERRVGRRWDDVYSEIRRHIRATSATQLHVLQHLERMVERRTVVLDGKVCRPDGRPVWAEFYVCPETGRLRRSPRG